MAVCPPEEEPQTLAERQLANARNDPRLDRGGEAMIADWWIGLEAAERTRTVAVLAISRLAQHADDAPWEHVELAKAEIANEFVEFNAQALVAMLSALDSLVEALVPRAREMFVSVTIDQAFKTALEQVPEAAQAAEQAREKLREAATEVMSGVLEERLGKIKRAKGVGVKRWEEVLRGSDLHAPTDREIPADLDAALEEMVSLRHVLVHRAGRVDAKALEDAPSLPYEAEQLVRITRDDYRRYSAAIRSYGEEVIWRFVRGIGLEPPDLTSWRDNYIVGT